ncbi:MAG: 4Fe-4S binding protein [Planctomycetaceae bacterium]|nr:4Fe-4S binding protein [Planctomycetaceae bacterium]
MLTVCTVGCAGCVDSHVQVSNACVGCFARPCVSACPKKAIAILHQRSTIDRAKCVDCGRCMTVCPYKAIVRNPLPCEDACPVGAIGKGDDGRVRINFERCIYCGKCFRACPFSTIMIRSELVGILQAMKEGKQVVAMIAPSITEQFPEKGRDSVIIGPNPPIPSLKSPLGTSRFPHLCSGGMPRRRGGRMELPLRKPRTRSCSSLVSTGEKTFPTGGRRLLRCNSMFSEEQREEDKRRPNGTQ